MEPHFQKRKPIVSEVFQAKPISIIPVGIQLNNFDLYLSFEGTTGAKHNMAALEDHLSRHNKERFRVIAVFGGVPESAKDELVTALSEKAEVVAVCEPDGNGVVIAARKYVKVGVEVNVFVLTANSTRRSF